MRIRCEYDTTSRSSCTQGGDKSSQEMCLHFMAVYPATSVAEMAVLESSFTEYVSDGVAACVGGAGVRTLDAGCGRSVGGTSGGKEAASGRVAGGIEGIGVPSAV